MDFADEPYKRKLAAMVQRVCAKYGLGERTMDALLTRDVGGKQDRFTERKGPAPAGFPVSVQTLLFA